jgi:hypothetical protein
MLAGRQSRPWHTPEVIPTTLALKTGKVSWGSMGLRRVPFLAKVLLATVEVPGVRRPAWKLLISRSSLAELHRPPRDAPAPRPIWLETAVRPRSGARSLGTCAASGHDPTLRLAQCCSVLSCHLDSSVSVMILENVMW